MRMDTLPCVVPVLRPLRQSRTDWFKDAIDIRLKDGFPAERWFHYATDIQVLTAVEAVREKHGERRPEYHLSASQSRWSRGRFSIERLDTNAAKWVLAEFGLLDAEEDNHVPHGRVRNFWRPVASPLVGQECPCKAEEVAITENKGDFIWRP